KSSPTATGGMGSRCRTVSGCRSIASGVPATVCASRATKMSNLISYAHLFAAEAHLSQVRKYTNEPYILHPRAVAALARSAARCTEEMIAAAYLHDVVED